jgi:hypothetical protein
MKSLWIKCVEHNPLSSGLTRVFFLFTCFCFFGENEGKKEEGGKKWVYARVDAFFESLVEVPRIRYGNRQTLETLINEEAYLLAKFLRNDSSVWHPRVA